MRRLLAVLAVYTVLVLPAALWATGSLTTPNVIFTTPNPVPTSKLDANWNAHAAYINAREVTFGLLSARPTAGVSGRYYYATDTGAFYADNGTAWVQLSAAPLINQRASLTIANSTTSTQFFNIFPGAVTSDDALSVNRVMLENTSTISKKLTTWAVGTGNGCLDTGAAAVFTWYHVYAIERVDTGVVDVLCSVSGPNSTTSPTMPSSYTKKQRIGAVLTTWFATAGNEIYPFIQVNNSFRWASPATSNLDVSNATPGTAGNTATLSVPNGVIVKAQVSCSVTGDGQLYVSAFFVTNEAPGPRACGAGAAGDVSGAYAEVFVDPAQRIRYRNSQNTATFIWTRGWDEQW